MQHLFADIEILFAGVEILLTLPYFPIFHNVCYVTIPSNS